VSTRPPRSAEVRAARGNLASLSVRHPPDHPKVVEARRILAAANRVDRIESAVSGLDKLDLASQNWIRRHLAKAPALSPHQRAALAALFDESDADADDGDGGAA
jgi:hypothetical protein